MLLGALRPELRGGGGGALPWQNYRYARRYFLGYKILILVFLGVFWKISSTNEILVFFGSAHFPYRVKMRSFQKFSEKFVFLEY